MIFMRLSFSFTRLFSGVEVTALRILHINEAFYHAKTDYRNSAFITNATIMTE